MKVAVAGGSGFLGSHICALLLTLDLGINISELLILDVNEPDFSHLQTTNPTAHRILKDIDNPAHKSPKVSCKRGSILDRSYLEKVLPGTDIVFNTVGIVDFGQHDPILVHDINYKAAIGLAQVGLRLGIKCLVYTSSVAVNQWRFKPNKNMKESDCCPALLEDFVSRHYGYSKSKSEHEILALDCSTFHVASIRPPCLFGEGDPYFLPTALNSLKNGNLFFEIGSALIETAYVGNVAFAHIFIMKQLLQSSAKVKGEAFLIGSEEKKTMFDTLHNYADIAGTQLPKLRVPSVILIYFAMLFDKIRSWLPQNISRKLAAGGFTEISMRCVGTTQTVDYSKIKALGYSDLYTKEAAIKNTRKWLGFVIN